MLENLLAPWRAKYRVAMAQTACYAVAGLAGAVALAFALAALFSWLSGLYGPITACLIIAGSFVVLALIPLFVLMSIQRREEARIAAAAAKARTTQWINPATLSLGLEAMRMVGKNRGLAAGAIGALLLGWLVSQMASSGTAEAEPADPPAE
jgi:hypothetical protein